MALPAVSLRAAGASQNQINVSVDASKVQGRTSSLGSILELPIEYQWVDVRTGPALISLEGWLRWHSDIDLPAGIRIPSQVLALNTSYLRIPVTQAQLFAIERTRLDGPVTLYAHLSGLANMRLVAQDGTKLMVTVPVDGMSPAYLQFHREQWSTLLTQMGFGKTRLVELPTVQLPHGADAWKECIRLFDLATTLFRSGQFEKSLETCREVVEGTITLLCANWGIVRQKGKNFEEWTSELKGRLTNAWPQDAEAATLFVSLYQTAWTWLSPSHHYGSKIPLYQEASFAISLASDLLSFGGYLYEAHPLPMQAQAMTQPKTNAPTS